MSSVTNFQMGVTQQVETPGLPTQPPVSRGAAMAGQLAQALGMAAQTAATVDRMAARTTAQRQREQARIDQLYTGQASMDARMAIPELGQRIEAGELDHLFDGEGAVEDAVRDFVGQQVGEGQPEAYAEQYQQIIAPWLTNQVTDRQKGVIEQARAESLQVLSESAIQATTADDIRGIVITAGEIAPNLSETEVLDAVVTPAVRSAVAAGDRDRFNAAVDALGGRFPGLVDAMRPRLEATIRERENVEDSATWRQAQNMVASALDVDAPNHEATIEAIGQMKSLGAARQLELKDRVQRHQLRQQAEAEQAVQADFRNTVAGAFIDGQPPDAIIRGILGWRGQVDDAMIDTALRDTRLRFDRQIREQYVAEQTAAMVNDAVSWLGEGDVTGGAPMLRDMLDGQVIQPPVGDPVEIDADEIIEQARQQTWQQIDEQFPVADEEQFAANFQGNLRAKMDWMRQNPGVKDPGLSRLFAGAFQRLPADVTDEGIPQTLGFAFDVFRQAGATHPRIRDAHMDDADLNFFRTANFIHENLPDVSPASAMAMAANGLRRDPAAAELARATPADGELDSAVRSMVNRRFRSDRQNPEYVRAQLSARARAYMIASGVSGERALERAAADFQGDHSIVNGWFVHTGGRPILDRVDLDSVAQAVIGAYVTDREDEDSRSFTVIPDPGGDMWRISFADSGLPAEESPALTDHDLMKIQEAIVGHERAEERRRRFEAAERERAARFAMTNNRQRQIAQSMRHTMSDMGVDPIALTAEPDRRPEQEPPAAFEWPEDPAHLRPIFEHLQSLPAKQRKEAQQRAQRRQEMINHMGTPWAADAF